MSDQKLLVVVGATGTQGSAVISHFLQHEPSYRIRGLTRNTTSDKAKKLAQQSVEVMQADLNDADTVTAAFNGANAIFAYTDSAGAAYSPDTQRILEAGEAQTVPEAAAQVELAQIKNIAHAAAATSYSLKRFVFSTIVDAVRASNGKFREIHEMSAKAKGYQYMLSLPQLAGKVNAVSFAVFVNTIPIAPIAFGWTKTGESEYAFRVPYPTSTRIPWIEMHRDAGTWVRALIDAPAGKWFEATAGYASVEEVVAIMSQRMGVKITAESIALEKYAEPDPSGVLLDVGLLYQFVADFGIRGHEVNMTAADEVVKQGYKVRRTGIKEALESLDYSAIL